MKYMNDKVTYIDAVLSLAPNSACRMESDGRTFEYFRNKSGIKQPTESEIDAEVIRLQAEYDAQEYARNRKAEYDALNQLEMQFDDKEDGTTTWEDAINAIKTKYPKG